MLLFAFPCFFSRVELFLGFALGIAVGRGVLELLLADRDILLLLFPLKARADLLKFRRLNHVGNVTARTGLINQVNGFVGQEAVRQIARGQLGGAFNGGIGDFCMMMLFIFYAQPLKNLNGFFDGRLLDHHGLEAAFERGILFNRLAVFVERGGADALQLSTGKCRFNNISGIHGALGRTGTDNRVQLIKKKQHIACFLDFIHHRFNPLLKLTAIFGAGNHQREVESNHFFAGDNLRHGAVGNRLSESFSDRGFANPGFPEQHRIILCAAAENLNNALDFILTANHRVEFSLACQLSQIAPERIECRCFGLFSLFTRLGCVRCFILLFGLHGAVVVGVEHGHNFFAGLIEIHTHIFEHAGGNAFAFAQQAEQNMLGADIAVAERAGLASG